MEKRERKLTEFKTSGKMEDFIKYKKLRAMTKKVIKKKKREELHRFAASLNKNISKYAWGKIRVLKKSWNNMDWHKWQIKSRKQEVENTVTKLALPWVSNKRREDISQLEEKKIENKKLNKEFNRSIRNTKSKSSRGIDNIEYEMIKNMPEKYKKELLKIFNYCYIKERIMDKQKTNQTIFIDKPDKEKIRPITLSSCVSKILERMINERLL